MMLVLGRVLRLALKKAQDGAARVDGCAEDVEACEGPATRAAAAVGRGGAGDPHLEAFLVLEEGGCWEDFLGEDPGVAAYGEEVAQRGVVQGEVGVGDGAGGEEGVDALFGVEGVGGVEMGRGLGVVVVLVVWGVVLAEEGGLLVWVELAAHVVVRVGVQFWRRGVVG